MEDASIRVNPLLSGPLAESGSRCLSSAPDISNSVMWDLARQLPGIFYVRGGKVFRMGVSLTTGWLRFCGVFG